eukprot:277613_1
MTDQQVTQSNAFDMTFHSISNAIAHELYDKIAASFMGVVKHLQILKVNKSNILQVINELKKRRVKKKKIRAIEIAYIKQLAERALTFQSFVQGFTDWNNQIAGDR